MPNAPWCLTDIRGSVRDFLVAHAVEEQSVKDIVLCAEEACTNALRHSGATEPAEVRVSVDHSVIEVCVADRGRGFDVDCIDLTRQPYVLAPGGRGLYLIGALADEMEVRNEEGTSVLFRKRRLTPIGS